MSDEKKKLMDVDDLADYLKLNRSTVYGMAQKGKLPGLKVGGSWRFKPEDVEKWIQDQRRETEKISKENKKS